MSCNKCNTSNNNCGCKDAAYTTPTQVNCQPDITCPLPSKCSEYIDASCVYLQDGIYDAALPPQTSLEEAIQQIILMISNPECTDTDSCNCPGGGGGGTYTVDNGLNENPENNFRLGGTLLENTTIDGASTYFLTLSSLQEFTTTSELTTIESSTFINLRAADVAIYSTANSRLFNINETLGQVTLDGYYASTGVLFTPTPAYGLGVDNVGNVLKIPFNPSAPPSAITADNGITANSPGNVRLGGPLVTNTQIPGATFNLSIGDRGSSSPIDELSLYANQLLLETPSVVAGTALVNQVLKLTNAATGEVEFGGAVNADEGLSVVNDFVKLGHPALSVGSDFTNNRFINTGNFNLTLSGTLAGASSATLVVNNNSGTSNPGGVGIRSVALGSNSIGLLSQANGANGVGVFSSGSQFGIQTQSSAGTGIQAETSSNSGFGVNAITGSTTGYALQAAKINAPVATIESVVNVLKRGVGNIGAAGIGASIDFSLSTASSGNERIATRLISTFTDATTNNRTSDFYIQGYANGTLQEAFRAKGNGRIHFPAYGTGSITGTLSRLLGVTSTGEIIESAAPGIYNVTNGLSELPLGTFKLGGTLIENTTITNSGFRLTVTGNSVDTVNPGVLRVINTNGANNSIALYAAAIGTGTNATTALFQSGGTNSNAALVTEATGANSISSITARYTSTSSSQAHAAIIANSTNVGGPAAISALTANSGTVPAIRAIKDLGTTYNTSQNVLSISTRGNGQSGGGSALYYEHVGVTGSTNIVTNRAESVWKNSNIGSYESTYRITGTNPAGSGQNTLIEIDSNVAAGTLFRIVNSLPTSSAGLPTGSLYTQTAAQIGGTGSTKVICIV